MRGHDFAAQADPSRNPQFRRQWSQPDGLRHVSGAADAATRAMAVKAARHWLAQADATTGDKRAACCEVAVSIIRMSGLTLAEVQGRRAA